jgi:hypothetical protein
MGKATVQKTYARDAPDFFSRVSADFGIGFLSFRQPSALRRVNFLDTQDSMR